MLPHRTRSGLTPEEAIEALAAQNRRNTLESLEEVDQKEQTPERVKHSNPYAVENMRSQLVVKKNTGKDSKYKVMSPEAAAEHKNNYIFKMYQRQGETTLKRLAREAQFDGRQPRIDYLKPMKDQRADMQQVLKFDMKDVISRAKGLRKEHIKEEAYLSHLVEYRTVAPESKMTNWNKKVSRTTVN